MALSQKALGVKLQAARKSVSLTQQEAADQIQINREAISHIEAGVRSVNSLEISRLAKLYGRSLASILVEEECAEEDALTALFRMQEALSETPGLREKLVWFVNIFQEARNIERLLGDLQRNPPPDYGLQEPGNIAMAYMQGQELASQERQRLGLGWGLLSDVPGVISQQGVWAVSVEMPDDVSGICLSHTQIGAAVIINSSFNQNRRRFAYAHEYAHALADRKNRPVTISASGNAKELIERRANSFASEFLMPAKGVQEVLCRIDKGGASRETMWFFDPTTEEGESAEKRNSVGSQEIGFHDVAYLADWFQVSYEAAAYRLSDLGKLNRDRLQTLLQQRETGRQGVEQPEDERPLPDSYIRWLAREAYRREVISGGRFRDFCALAKLDVEEEYAKVKKRFD